MINIEITFPVLGLKEEDSNVYVFSNHIGIVSKGGEKFYNKLWIVDSNGNTFFLTNAKLKGKAPLKYSLKYFQTMYELDLTFESNGKISLDELNQKIYNHISAYEQKWISLGTVEMMKEKMDKCTSYENLIKTFR